MLPRAHADALALLLLVTALPASAQRVGFPLNEHTRLGQRFTSPQSFVAVCVTAPSWMDNEGGFTLTLWDTPVRSKQLARKVFAAIRDNEVIELRQPKPLPRGVYYWEASERTGQTFVGLYADALPVESSDCAYIDGTPDRKRRFVFEVVASPMPRPGVPRLIASLGPGSSPQQKEEACRQLAVVGNASAVPALARLLADPTLSHMARYAMENLPDKAVDAAFRAALGRLSGRQLTGVINSVAVRRDAGAVGRLCGLLRKADPEAAAAAAAALGRIGTPAAAAILAKELARAPTPARAALYEGCLSCADMLRSGGLSKAAIKLYDQLRSAQTPRAIRAAAGRGAVLARGSNGLAVLRQMLRSGDPDVRRVALWMVQREVLGRDVTLALSSDLGALSVDTQVLLIAALAGRRDKAALPALRSAAANGAKLARLAAVAALPGLGAMAAPSLVSLMSGADADVRKAAQDAVASLPIREVALVASSLLQSPDLANRLSAIALARRLRLPGYAVRIAAALRDRHPDVRLASARALEELADADQIPALRDALVGAPDALEADAMERALAAACGRAGDPERVASLLTALVGQVTPSHRAALLRVLGGVGGARALIAMREAIAEPAGAVRSTAIDVLCSWPTDAAAPELMSLAHSAADPAERLDCIRGVLRIAAIQEVPSERRLRLCREAAELVQRDEEKRLLLGALGGIASSEALDLVVVHFDSPQVRQEACAAVLAISEKLVAGPDAARSVGPLERVVGIAANPDFTMRAQALLERAKRRK